MITIIDYGMGNLRSVARAFEHVGANVLVTHEKEKIINAEKLVLPGVGSFAHCMEYLHKFDLIDPIKDHIQSGKLFFGICLGLQVLFDSSEEGGEIAGLGVIPGLVRRFEISKPVPHMGWNQIEFKKASSLFSKISNKSDFYFVHSYHVVPDDESVIASTTDYGIQFCSAIHKDNVYACQFHPEKSQEMGLKLIKGFVEIKQE